MKLTYNIKDKPKFGQLIVFAFQQLLAILAATILVPAIVGHDMEQSAALFGAGVGTLVYQLFTKFKSPVFLGSSFAFLGSMAAAFAGGVSASLGYAGLILGAVLAGLVYVVIALIVKFVGVKWIDKLMPKHVIGPTVSIIGLSLAGNAISDLLTGKFKIESVVNAYADGKLLEGVKQIAMGTSLEAATTYNTSNMVSSANPYVCIIVGLVTLFVVMICSVYGKKTAKMIPFVIGIIAGYAVAVIITLIGTKLDWYTWKVIDFSVFEDMKLFAVPAFTFRTALAGFKEMNAQQFAKIAVAYVPVAFVVFAEHIADHKNISSIIEKDLLDDPGLHRTLLGDGVGSMVGAFFGGCPNTTYGESIGCVAITGNASVVTITATAVIAIIFSFFSPFVTFLGSIPNCVMGGVCIALYGFIAVSGLKMIQKVDLEDNANLFTVSVILICGIGGLTVSFGEVSLTSIACALILGIIANIVLHKKNTAKSK